MSGGAVVLFIALSVGIIVGIKSKKLTVTELTVCGMWGLLLGMTSMGGQVSGMLGDLGNWLTSLPG